MRLLASGPVACFRRPEFAHDLVTYDVMPPMVAIRMLERVVPGSTRWRILRLHVLRPIRFDWMELSTSRGGRRALVLTDVAYLIEAVEMTTRAGISDRKPPPLSVQPDRVHLGLEDFSASIAILAEDDNPYMGNAPQGFMDLGWMICETRAHRPPVFRRLSMTDGVIDFERQNQALQAS